MSCDAAWSSPGRKLAADHDDRCPVAPGARRGRPAAPRATASRWTSSAARPRCRDGCACWTPNNWRTGAAAGCRLVLDAPVAVAPGDRFIIRQASPSLTLGGGNVVNPHPRRRWRRFEPEFDRPVGDPGARDAGRFGPARAPKPRAGAPQSGYRGLGLDMATAEAVLARMFDSGDLIPLGALQPPLARSQTPAISVGGWRTLAARMAEILADYHAQYPLRPGMAREELKSRVQGREKWSPKLFNELVARGGRPRGALSEVGEIAAPRPAYRISFTRRNRPRSTRVLAAFRQQPYTPPSMAESLAHDRPRDPQRAAAPGRAGAAERGCVCCWGKPTKQWLAGSWPHPSQRQHDGGPGAGRVQHQPQVRAGADGTPGRAEDHATRGDERVLR